MIGKRNRRERALDNLTNKHVLVYSHSNTGFLKVKPEFLALLKSGLMASVMFCFVHFKKCLLASKPQLIKNRARIWCFAAFKNEL